MRKVPVGWTLTPKNVENVKKAARNDSRPPSQWVDVLLTKYFAENPV